MRFNCGPTPVEKYNYYMNWHEFFAVLPVRVEDGSCRCFEMVQRKYTFRLAAGRFENPIYRSND